MRSLSPLEVFKWSASEPRWWWWWCNICGRGGKVATHALALHSATSHWYVRHRVRVRYTTTIAHVTFYYWCPTCGGKSSTTGPDWFMQGLADDHERDHIEDWRLRVHTY